MFFYMEKQLLLSQAYLEDIDSNKLLRPKHQGVYFAYPQPLDLNDTIHPLFDRGPITGVV